MGIGAWAGLLLECGHQCHTLNEWVLHLERAVGMIQNKYTAKDSFRKNSEPHYHTCSWITQSLLHISTSWPALIVNVSTWLTSACGQKRNWSKSAINSGEFVHRLQVCVLDSRTTECHTRLINSCLYHPWERTCEPLGAILVTAAKNLVSRRRLQLIKYFIFSTCKLFARVQLVIATAVIAGISARASA
jgi:hypothetical protein